MITHHTNLIPNVYYFVCWLATGKRYSSKDKISNKIPDALILDFVVMTKPKGQSRVAVGARQFQNNKKTNKQMNLKDNCSQCGNASLERHVSESLPPVQGAFLMKIWIPIRVTKIHLIIA